MRSLGIRRRFQVFADWLLTVRATSMSLRLVVAAVIAMSLASTACFGSAALASASSGKIGCKPSEIAISDDEGGWGTRTWTATCNGRRYYCSATQTGRNSGDISCSANE